MEKSENVHPKVFISYSWTTQEHQDWILEWAERLCVDGVDVILDLWHLKQGNDKYAFMERMVTDPEIVKVIIFSDSQYATKADKRKGGVGTESQIISKEVYEKVLQEKFIPVVCEINEEGVPCLPTFLKSRIHIDFSTADKANENYDQLLRVIYDRPLHQKPALGQPPKHLFENSKSVVSSRPLLTQFKNAIINDRSNYKGLARYFLEDFFSKIPEFRIDPSPNIQRSKDLDELVVESIDAFIPFRNDFVEFVSLVCSFRDEIDLYDEIAEFFERSLFLQYPSKGVTHWDNDAFDNFRFVTYELFLYVIALLIKHKRFNHASVFLEKIYTLPENVIEADPLLSHKSFVAFSPNCDSLRKRIHRLQLKSLSLEADFVKIRATLPEISFEQLVQADLVCFLKSLIFQVESYAWFPYTAVYVVRGRPLDFFIRARSHSEFEKVLMLLNVKAKEELINKYTSGAEKYRVAQWAVSSYRRTLSFPNVFNFDQLDTI